MGCNMCVVHKAEEQHRGMLQVGGKEPPPGSPRPPPPAAARGAKEPLVLQVLRRRPPPPGPAPHGPAATPWGGGGSLVDSGTQTDISFHCPLGSWGGSPGGAEPPPLPQDYVDPPELGEPERPEELEYEEVQLHKASQRDKLGLTLCYRTDGEEDGGIYVGEVNPNSIAAKDGRIREGDRIVQINGQEVQDREEAVALLSRPPQAQVWLLLARPEGGAGGGQRRDPPPWNGSDREDFLESSEPQPHGNGSGGPWTPPGQPPSPSTPCARGAEPDSGVGRTDESTRNEESSEHDLLGEEGGEGPPRDRDPAPGSPRPRGHPRPGPPPRPGSGSSSGSGSAGRAPARRPGAGTPPTPPARFGGRPCGANPPSPVFTHGARPAAAPAAGSGFDPGGRGAVGAPPPALAFPAPASPPEGAPGLSAAELRRYRQLRGRLGAAAAAGRAELALLEEELRHLEFKCRHLLRAQKMERLRQRCLRAWLEAAGAEAPLADIAEAPERDSTSTAYNTGGESCRSSPLLPRAPGAAAAPPAKAARAKRPGRDRLLKARAIKILEERGGGSTTEDDARSELKTGRYWSREQRKQHLARAREQRRRREMLLQARAEPPGAAAGATAAAAEPGAGAAAAAAPGTRRGLRKRSRRILDNWATIQEMLARGSRAGDGGRIYNPLLSVTTV